MVPLVAVAVPGHVKFRDRALSFLASHCSNPPALNAFSVQVESVHFWNSYFRFVPFIVLFSFFLFFHIIFNFLTSNIFLFPPPRPGRSMEEVVQGLVTTTLGTQCLAQFLFKG